MGEHSQVDLEAGGSGVASHDVDVRRELTRRLAQQAAVAELGQAALSGLTVDKLCELAVEQIHAVLGVEFAKVLQLAADGRRLIVKAGIGWHQHVKAGVTSVPNDARSQAGYTLLLDEPVIVPDFAAEHRFLAPELLLEHSVVSGMSVVIPTRTGPYGVIGVHASEPRLFTMHDGAFLQAVANVIGSAVQNARWFEEVEVQSDARERRARGQAALARCAHALLAGEGQGRLQEAMDALLDATDSSYVFLQQNTVDDDGQPGIETLVSASQAPPEEVEALSRYWRRAHWSALPTSRAVLERGEIYTGNPAELTGPEAEIHLRAPAVVRSELKCPIFVNGAWVGMVGCSDTVMERVWTEDERQLYETAAAMIGAYWEREAAREILMGLVRSKDEFLASVSHELRTPLTGVVGFGEILRDPRRSFTASEREELLDVMLRQANDLSNIVEDLSIAAKADLGTLYVSMGPVDLAAQVSEALESFDPTLVADLEVTRQETWVTADAARIRQIVRNLVSNAFRYGGDVVRIGVERRGDAGSITVRDDGQPIGEQDRVRIFEPFERAHAVRGVTAALGLGLSISKRLAELMGGELFYSHDGRESIFELRLPMGG